MNALSFESLQVGCELEGIEVDPISRLDLALYCGASGDHNPIHVDIDFARAAGRPDVFTHGMLVMAHMGRALARWAPPAALREFSLRFVQVTGVGDRLRCDGTVVTKFETGGERCIRVELGVRDQARRLKATGWAVLVLA